MTDLNTFPNNIVEALATRFAAHPATSDWPILKRAPRINDANQSLGIHPDDWQTVGDSVQIGGRGEPHLANYTVKIENLVLSLDEPHGQALFSVNAKIVRVILYRDPILHATLRSLTETVEGSKETVKRFWIARQKFQVGQVRSQWAMVCTTDFVVQAETIQTA